MDRYPRVGRLAVDFDSTLFPLLDAIAAHEDGEGVGYATIHTWAGLADACGGVEKMLRIFEEVMIFEWMERFPPFPGAAETLRSLHERGIEVQLLSDRRPGLSADVERYLTRWEIQVDRVLCRSGFDKVAWCLENEIDVIVDDHPDTLERAHEAGLTALGLEFHYNRSVFRRLRLPVASSWAELEANLSPVLPKP